MTDSDETAYRGAGRADVPHQPGGGDRYGTAGGRDIVSSGHRSRADDVTTSYPTTGRGSVPRGRTPEVDLDAEQDMHVAPPPLRPPTRVQPAILQRSGWSAIETTARPTSAPRTPPAVNGPRLRVDWPNCKAHGLCHELLPEAVALDEWGYPVVSTQPIHPHLIDDARRAVVSCPTLALRLVDPH